MQIQQFSRDNVNYEMSAYMKCFMYSCLFLLI